MDFLSQPKTYQDVKANLRNYTAVVVIVVAFAYTLWVLPRDQVTYLGSVVVPVVQDPLWSKILGVALITSGAGFISYLLVFVLEVHDKWYDRYLVRWRHYYALDYILPRLTRPFAHKLDRTFFRRAETDLGAMLKPFYKFVGDGSQETKITENLVVRFYEAITKYWMSQINEMVIWLVLLVSAVYAFVYNSKQLPMDRLAWCLLLLAVAFAINRAFRCWVLGQVRHATAEEIDDIHERYMAKLDEHLRKLHEDQGMKYGT